MAISGSVSFEPLSGGSGAWGFPELEEMSATGSGRGPNLVEFEVLTASGEAHGGAAGAAAFERMEATGDTVPVNIANGAVFFEALQASGGTNPEGAALFEVLSAVGYARGPVTGAVSFQPLEVLHRSGYAEFQPLTATGLASETLQEVYAAKVMNTRSGAVTEYTNYQFNSFARIGRDWHGAGPAGLVKLTGTQDGSTNIDWSFRTGQLDGDDEGLKRLPEVLAGLRTNGRIKVRVWKDDNVVYDYDMPSIASSTIRQQRVKIGRGMRSRWFKVGMEGQGGATLELTSLQINMTDTTRRIG